MSDRAIAMMASEPFVFHGRSLAVFDYFLASADEARRLSSYGLAVIRQKRYQTADVTPEVAPVTVAAPEPEPEAPPVKRRRTYKRRDLTAESA